MTLIKYKINNKDVILDVEEMLMLQAYHEWLNHRVLNNMPPLTAQDIDKWRSEYNERAANTRHTKESKGEV